MDKKVCCVTGHRDIPANKIEYVKEELQKEIQQAIEDGFTTFISGFAAGVDLFFVEIVVECKQKNKLFLEAALPHPGRLKTKDQAFHRLLAKCDGVHAISEESNRDCFMLRNRYMVQQSSRVIAVYDGREKGGTLFTLRYAHTQEREVRLIQI